MSRMLGALPAAVALWCWVAVAGAAATTIEIRLADRPTLLDVYRPVTAPRGAVVLAHGFTRDRATLAGYGQALADENIAAFVPDLPFFADARGNGRAVAELVEAIRSGRLGPPIDRVVLVGFSAGGLATLLAAATPGVVGWIGLDPFDRPVSHPGQDAARTLQTPAVMLRGPASFCNANGSAAPWSGLLPRLAGDRMIDGASHCDFEWPTDRVCTIVCGATDAARQRAIRTALMEAIGRWLPLPSTVLR